MTLRAAALAALLVLAAPAGARAACADEGVQATPETLDAVRVAMRCAINEQRAEAGVPTLRDNADLDRSAADHSADMVRHHYLAHEAAGRPSLYARVRATGYFNGAADALYSENIGLAPTARATAVELVDAWMTSPEHRENLLHPSFRDIGIGAAFADPDPAFYPGYASAVFTTDFGQRHLRPGRPGRRCVVRLRKPVVRSGPSAAPRRRYCRH